MQLVPWGDLTILAAVLEIVFATCVFVYIGRLERRASHPLGDVVGAHKAVLAKLRKGEAMSQAKSTMRRNWSTMPGRRSPTRYPQRCSPLG